MLCDYFLSSVTDGLQPNAEESGTGCRRLAIGLQACAQTHTPTHPHTHFPLPIKHDWLPLHCLSTTYIHEFNFVVFTREMHYLLLTYRLTFVID